MRILSIALLAAALIASAAVAARSAETPKPYDVRSVFNEADVNGDGEIDLSEFHARVIEIFFNADTDKSSALSPEEYGRLPFSGDFNEADLSHKGQIGLHDFVAVRYRQFIVADRNRDGALKFDEVLAAYEGTHK